MGGNSFRKTVTRQHRDCDFNPGPSAPESSTLTTRLPSHPQPLLHPFNDLFSRTTCVSRYQKGKTSPDLNEARDDGVLGCSGDRWTICKQSAPRSRQITTTTPHHSIFYRPDALQKQTNTHLMVLFMDYPGEPVQKGKTQSGFY